MEPLLDLVAQFARDLGQRFEKHFALTVTLVAKVAATHSSIEVIEWSFTCLAWIFKFLARLLVPDLRQLLSIMSPYLGKEKQKHFVSRFAAESMSFLIRKAALVYYKNQAPLDKAVSFLIHDLTAVTDAAHIAMYQDGLMAMLSDSIKGVKAGLYSNGTDIIQALIRAVLAVHGPGKESARRVLDGVIINLIHSTTSDTFTPVLDTVCNTFTGEGTPALDATRYEVFTRLLFLVVVTRKGSRIHDWKTVHAALVTVLDANLGSLDSHAEATPMVLSTVANAVQSSPMDDLLPSMRPLLSRVAEPALAAFFLSFCTLSAELGLERFQSVVLPHLQKFITSCWQEHEAEICITLPHLLSISAVTFKSEKKGSISLPANWVAHIESKLLDTSPSEDDIPILHAFASFGLADVLTSGSTAISQRLHSLIRAALQSPADLHHNLRQFALGSGFSSYCGLASKSHSIDCGLWSLIEAHGSDHAREPAFLRAVLDFIDRCPLTDKPTATQLDAFANSLITNLSSPSSQLRILSLRLLRVFSTWVGLQDEGCVAICLEIESSDLTLETERQLNMQLRKLAIKYHEFANKTWLSRLLPTYCFGILSKQLGTLVDTACDALETICDVKEGETWVSDLAVRLFTTSEQAVQSDRVDLEEESHDDDVVDRRNYSEYECFNVAATERRLERVFSPARDCQTRLAHAFTLAHAMPDALPQSARSKALKVLNAVPQVAEKHSRQIVPHFLAWAAHDDDIDESPAGDEEPEEPNDSVACYTTGSLWSLTDRKTMLAVLGKFVNPKVLYQASEAREALLGLLTSGDPETQKLALKALFTWKSSSIHPYEANLLNILDEKRLKDELTVFVHVDDDSSTIEVQHRPELMPILFRLLYGRVVSRQGSRTNRGTQEGRRKMIIRTISQLPDFEQFLRIAFGPLSDISVTHASNVLEKELMGTRKQFGLLRMIATMLDTLGVKMRPHAQQLLDVVLYCLIRACRCIGQSNAEHTEALLRSVRQTGVKCLDLLFATSAAVDWPYVTLIYTEVVRPRLPTLAIETAQGVSGLLQLFKTWSSDLRSCVYFTQGDGSIIRELINVLAVDSARDEVKGFVMQQIFSNILDYADGRKPKHLKTEGDLDSQLVERVRAEVLAPYIEALLIQLEQLLRSQLRKQMTVPAIETLSRLAPFVQSSGETTKLVRTTTYLLQQPADRIPPKAKSGILDVLRQFLPIYDPQGNDALNEEIFQTLASLFDYFKDEPNRKTVSLTLSALAEHDKSLAEVASLCEGLNSLSQKKLESVDYERRLAAFRTINEEGYARFDARQWRPILYNCLYHVKDREELAIRSSAAHGLRRFIERSVPSACQDDPAFAALLTDTLLPALRAGVKLPHEIVRVEFVQLMGYAVAHHPEQDSIHDMEPLLAGGDEEASFFTNVLHIQQHRRTRALRRLASESTKGTLRAANISTFFLPLIEHYVFDQAEDENAHNLAAEAVAAIGQLSANLEWSQFRAIYRRYRSYVQTKAGLEKNVLRLLGRMTDCLADALKPSDGDTAMVDVGSESEVQPFAVSGALARSLPGVEKVRLELKSNFIPYLTKFTHLKDESEVNLRLPAAVIAVKMIHLLSEEESGALLPAVLLDVSNVLRSRSQESRDAARKTLSDIALILGASYFGHILKELRSTLQRGYQLHVLSYTVHSMLVNTSEHFKPGDLDNDLELMADIVIEDIFGTVGQEKEAEEYISKMKEVKSSKSFDSMELLAKNASITRLAALVRPIQLLLQEKLTSRIVLKVDELLRRIGIGLIRNPGAESRDVLVFSYEVIKEANQQNDLPVVSEIEDREQKRRARYLINLRSARNNANKGATTAYTHKLARFGLD
ncbi:U3 snoRNP protein, partial [Ascosphaera acerosa]